MFIKVKVLETLCIFCFGWQIQSFSFVVWFGICRCITITATSKQQQQQQQQQSSSSLA
jgi:hypothetical protein